MNFRVIGKLISDDLLTSICFFIPGGTYKTNQITHDLSLHSLLLNSYIFLIVILNKKSSRLYNTVSSSFLKYFWDITEKIKIMKNTYLSRTNYFICNNLQRNKLRINSIACNQ